MWTDDGDRVSTNESRIYDRALSLEGQTWLPGQAMEVESPSGGTVLKSQGSAGKGDYYPMGTAGSHEKDCGVLG